MVVLTIDENNNKVIQLLNLNIQETIILRAVEKYFIDENNFDILKTIISGENIISRRTIEYFVTKYSHIKNITYFIEFLDKKVKFNVYSSYKDKLKCHKKKYFDPFGRGDRIPFFSNDSCIITTIGQLNFYKWFITNNIYKYCLDNHNKIQTSLLDNFSKNKKKSNKINQNLFYKNNIVKNYYNTPINLSVSFDV
jgi:hypothetical protein